MVVLYEAESQQFERIYQVVEKAYQQTKKFDKLSFLYLATGSTDKLGKMQKIADARGDPMSRFHNALYAGDVEGRISVLRDVGLRACFSLFVDILSDELADPLAYLTAKTNGFNELALEILAETGLTEADIDDIPAFPPSTLKPPPIVTPTTDLNWPTIATAEESFFDKALAGGALDPGAEGAYANGDAAVNGTAALDEWAKDEEAHEDEAEGDGGGWELEGDDFHFSKADDIPEPEEELGAGATPGHSEVEHWVKNSPLAVDHVAAGSFETAMQVCLCTPPTRK